MTRLKALSVVTLALAGGGVDAAELAGRAVAVQPAAYQATGMVGLPVAVHDKIFRQAKVYTKQYGTMDIRLEDGTNLTVAPNASLVIDEYVFAGENRPGRLALSLTRGAVRMVSGRMPKGGVALNTPTATLGVRGTDFWVNAASEDLIELWVMEGVVTAAPSQSATVYEFAAPAYASCSASSCAAGAAPPVPVVNPIGGEAGDNGGAPGFDPEMEMERDSLD